MASVPPSLIGIADRVECRLDELIAAETARWTALDPELRAPFDALRSLVLSGGKRLRPAFCYWGWVGAGGADGDQVVIDAGAAFELLHAFALFHDDVMDGSASRRGARTAHLTFADRHVDGAWRGEARRFGEGVAILVGDLAFVAIPVECGTAATQIDDCLDAAFLNQIAKLIGRLLSRSVNPSRHHLVNVAPEEHPDNFET